MTWFLMHFNAPLFSFGTRTLHGGSLTGFSSGVRCIDVVLARHPAADVMQSGTYVPGRKGAQA
jgi:hypothetical protein